MRVNTWCVCPVETVNVSRVIVHPLWWASTLEPFQKPPSTKSAPISRQSCRQISSRLGPKRCSFHPTACLLSAEVSHDVDHQIDRSAGQCGAGRGLAAGTEWKDGVVGACLAGAGVERAGDRHG